MIVQSLLDQLAALVEARIHAVLLTRAASELPGVVAVLDPAGIRLTAHHLRSRAFGTRHRRRDVALALFARSGR